MLNSETKQNSGCIVDWEVPISVQGRTVTFCACENQVWGKTTESLSPSKLMCWCVCVISPLCWGHCFPTVVWEQQCHPSELLCPTCVLLEPHSCPAPQPRVLQHQHVQAMLRWDHCLDTDSFLWFQCYLGVVNESGLISDPEEERSSTRRK